MKKAYYILFLVVIFLTISYLLPVRAMITKPAYALNEEDVDGWWIDREDGISIEYGSVKMTSWWQIWINNETWTKADTAFYLMIMDYDGLLDFDTIWEGYVIALVGYLPEARNITGFNHAVIYNESAIWYGLASYGDRLVWILGTDEQGIPGIPDYLYSSMKAPKNGTGTEQDVETLLIAQGTIISLDNEIPGFVVLPILAVLGVLIGIITLIRKKQLIILPTN